MDYMASLTAAEAQSLADPDRTFDDAVCTLEQLRPHGEWAFQMQIRLKNTLDAYEKMARAAPRWSLLATLLNCEYAILRLTAPSVPIRHNPFLSHWVESYQCLARTHEDHGHHEREKIGLTAGAVAAVWAEWIKSMLLSGESDTQELSTLTPRIFYETTTKRAFREPFPIQPYIRILIEEDIYDTLPGTAVHDAHPSGPPPPPSPVSQNAMKKSERLGQSAPDDWKTAILDHLLPRHPDMAIQELTRLPLQLLHLDFLTKLLADHALEEHAIDPAPVITSYIQHSLRTIEMMGEPPPASDQGRAATDSAARHLIADTNRIWEYGKEAQSRHVKLLLLFIKSLVRKGLLGADVLYFEIQEICVRYVWIKQVRDFRAWVEGIGEADEQG